MRRLDITHVIVRTTAETVLGEKRSSGPAPGELRSCDGMEADREHRPEESAERTSQGQAVPLNAHVGVLWLQQHAGNAATSRVLGRAGARRLQRLEWRDFDLIGAGLEGLAKFNFSVPLCKDLIDHYSHGNGTELGLTSLGMAQCNALIDFGNDKRSPQFLRFVKQMGEEIARNSGGDPSRLTTPLESDVSFSMLGACNTSGTLGDFTVNASGKLRVWSPDPDGTNADWSFDGWMWWYDRWDFDQRAASAKGTPGRTGKGSWRTDVGSLLVGTPFDIKSASVKVHQARAEGHGPDDHYAKWEGNPDGKKPPVVSGIL
jgi:hypothetical protein